MYGALWRSLPGPIWLRAVLTLLLLAALVVLLFLWVFPTVAPLMPFNDNTID